MTPINQNFVDAYARIIAMTDEERQRAAAIIIDSEERVKAELEGSELADFAYDTVLQRALTTCFKRNDGGRTMSITISEAGIVEAIENYIRLATKAQKQRGGDFHAATNRLYKNINAADAVLALAEKEAGLKVRTSTSIDGLNKRLSSLINGGSKR